MSSSDSKHTKKRKRASTDQGDDDDDDGDATQFSSSSSATVPVKKISDIGAQPKAFDDAVTAAHDLHESHFQTWRGTAYALWQATKPVRSHADDKWARVMSPGEICDLVDQGYDRNRMTKFLLYTNALHGLQERRFKALHAFLRTIAEHQQDSVVILREAKPLLCECHTPTAYELQGGVQVTQYTIKCKLCERNIVRPAMTVSVPVRCKDGDPNDVPSYKLEFGNPSIITSSMPEVKQHTVSFDYRLPGACASLMWPPYGVIYTRPLGTGMVQQLWLKMEVDLQATINSLSWKVADAGIYDFLMTSILGMHKNVAVMINDMVLGVDGLKECMRVINEVQPQIDELTKEAITAITPANYRNDPHPCVVM